jgi:tetratricopeptide (TPR) repeat protein
MSLPNFETINGSRYTTEWNKDAHMEERSYLGYSIVRPRDDWGPVPEIERPLPYGEARKRVRGLGAAPWTSSRDSATTRLSVEEKKVVSRLMWHEANRHFRSRDYESSSAAYTRALDGINQRDRVNILSNRAECYLRLGFLQQARADAEAALRINPDHTKSQNRLKRCGGQ